MTRPLISAVGPFVLVFTLFLHIPASAAGSCSGNSTMTGPQVACEEHRDVDVGDETAEPVANFTGTVGETIALPACKGNQPGGNRTDAECAIFSSCDTDTDRYFQVWERPVEYQDGRRTSVGEWTFLGAMCLPIGAIEETSSPRITWQLVLREIERVGLPALQVQVQPAEKTLVNFETIFYADPEPFERQLRLLGQRVDVRATPDRFDWTFGDGATMQTETAGRPYPSKEIVHEYADADVTVSPSVDVTYTAEFRVNGGAWQSIPETITIPGPDEDLRIVEATAVRVGSGD